MDEPAISADEQLEGKSGGLLRQPVLAHWQLECHGRIYEFGPLGHALDPFGPLEFKDPSTVTTQTDKYVFYRKKIGRTRKSHEEILERGKRHSLWSFLPQLLTRRSQGAA